jgi:hypothetical protein
MTPWIPVTDDTQRLTVPGGWLYRTCRNGGEVVALVFVPAVAEDATAEAREVLDPEAVALDLDEDIPF